MSQCACICEQDIRNLHAAFVLDAAAKCKEAAEAVEGAHEALIASGEAQAQQLERTIVAQHAAAQRALVAAQANVAATIRCHGSCRAAACRCISLPCHITLQWHYIRPDNI